MKAIVAFLVSTPDDSTDYVQAFAEDVAHIYGPVYVGVLDYGVVVEGTDPTAALAGLSWNERASIEAGKPLDDGILCTLCKVLGLGHDGEHLLPR